MEQIFQDKEFQALPADKQKSIVSNYFDKNYADKEFSALAPEEQTKIKDNFFNSQTTGGYKYLQDEATASLPAKEDFIQLPAKKEPVQTERPDVSDPMLQYQMGLMSKIADPMKRVENAQRIFNKFGYKITDYEKAQDLISTTGESIGIGSPYIYTLEKDDGSKFKLDETGLQQSIMNYIGDIGQYTGGALGAIIGRGAVGYKSGAAIGNMVDQFVSHAITGEELDAKERSIEVGKALGEVFAEVQVAKGASAVAKGTKNLIVGKVGEIASPLPTKELMTIADKGQISHQEAWNLIKDVAPERRASLLADYGGGRTFGLKEMALREDVSASDNYVEIVNARKRAVEETLGKATFDEQQKIVNGFFQQVKDEVKKIPLENSFDGSSLADVTKKLQSSISTSDKSKDLLEKMATIYKDQPAVNMGELVDLRMRLNYEWSRASGESKGLWKEAKDNVDTFLKQNVGEGTTTALDTANALYSSTKATEEALAAIEKSSVGLGKGIRGGKGEVGAIDWNKLNNELKDVYSASPEVKNAMELTQSFQNKFGDIDAKLFRAVIPEGVSTSEKTIIAQTPQGHLQRLGVEKLFEFIKKRIGFGSEYDTIQAQRAFAESIKKSDSQVEFLMNVRRNPNTPAELKAATEEALSGIDTSVKGIVKQKVESAKLIKQTQDKQIQLNQADLAIDKAEDRLKKLESRRDKLPNTTHESVVASLDNQIEIAHKEYQLSLQKHSKLNSEFKNLNVELDNMKAFMTPKMAEKRPQPIGKMPTNFIKLED